MHPTLERSTRFEDLLALDEHDAPYVYEGIFRNDGWLARRRSRKKYKLLKRIDERLRPMLDDGERVRFLTFGVGLSFWESYFLGLFGMLLGYRAIVLTDRRILLVQIDWRERPRELHSQIRWPSIASMRRAGLAKLVLRLNDGSKRVFQSVPRADRRLLQELSEKMSGLVASADGGLEHLCPHCYGAVDGRPARCPVCDGAFKSPRTAALRSLAFPGLGDFYLGHWKFALIETTGSAILWLSVLLTDTSLTGNGVLVFMAAFFFVFIHVPDALATRYVARMGLYPHGGTIGARVGLRRKAEARRAAAAGTAATAAMPGIGAGVGGSSTGAGAGAGAGAGVASRARDRSGLWAGMSPRARVAALVVFMLVVFGGMQVRASGQRDRLTQSYQEALLGLSKGRAPAPGVLTDVPPDDPTAKLLWIQVRAEEELRAGADSALVAQGLKGFDPPAVWMTDRYLRDARSYPEVGRHWEAYTSFHSGYAARIPDLTRSAVSRWGIAANLRPPLADQLDDQVEADMPQRMRRFQVRADIAGAALELHRALAGSSGRVIVTRDGRFEFEDASALAAYNAYLPRIRDATRELAVFDGELGPDREKMLNAQPGVLRRSSTVSGMREDVRRHAAVI